ncbi:MAG TPA: SusC/RagA family TonB-linked outer membrane protein [Hanamia sp.]|nr:SusC/RagA family TonB-linked outer membrane protein [Hanamia sp.]
MRKKFLLSGVLLLFCFFQTMAQQRTITGTVKSPDGKPLGDATVLVAGHKTGVTTKADGTFSINVPDKAKALEISFVGYANQSVDISSTSNVNVTLAYTAANLSDVVIVGYGTSRRRDLTGALASVQAKDFNQGAITTPDQLLQGKVAGLQITDNSGQPGSVATVKIRGNNSIRAGGNPLYVIDGVPLDGRSARPSITLGTGGFGVTPDVNPLLYINPNDIANITVLKDASATAIYGSRGANGVIVITTKTGVSGKTKLEVNASISRPAGYMKKFDILTASQFRTALKKYQLDTLSESNDKGSSVDALNAIVQNTLSQNYSLALSGGSEKGKFRASFLASDVNGFLKTTGLDKYIGTFSGQYKFLDNKLSIDFNLIAAHTTDKASLISSTAGSQGNLISSAVSWNPTSPFTDASGEYIYPGNGSGNPLALLAATSDISNANTFLGNISASYKILPHLTYKFLYAINNSAGKRYTNIDGYLVGYPGISGQGFGAISDQILTSQTFDHTLNYQTDFSDKFHFEGLLGYEYWKADFSNSSFSATGFNTNLDQMNQIPILYTSIMADGKTQNLPSTYIDPTTELQSYFARINLNYSEKIFLTATIRDDGSTKFGKNNKYGYFPSVGVKWLISNEDFMKNNSIFSTLAIRGSWGITGNQDFPAGASQEQFNFSAYNTAGQSNVANPNLKWESTTSYDAGLDYALLNGRIFGSIDYYNKNTSNILFQSTAIQPAPSSIYFINIPGNLMNKGVEFSVTGDVIRKTNFNLSVGFNIAYNKNILKNFYAPGTKNTLSILTGQITGQGVSGTLGQIITNDQPVDEFYLKPFGGFDASGNQIIGANPQFAGDPNPHVIYGANIDLSYKKFNVNINGSGAGGYLIYNNTATTITNIAGIVGGRNIDKKAFDSKEGTGSGVGASTRFLESGNFFKLRNATIRYTIGDVTKYVKNMDVFVSGTNLFVLTKFSGFDPEVNVDKSSSGYPSRSIEYVPYPTPRIISFGVNFSL